MPSSTSRPLIALLETATAGIFIAEGEVPVFRSSAVSACCPDVEARVGRRVGVEERAACRAYAALDCPSALRWALDHRDEEILRDGRTVLDRLGDLTTPS